MGTCPAADGDHSQANTDGGVVLETRKVTKTFEGLRAVNNCSLAVRKGTITGLIGPNGAGKTTLFNVVAGYYKPDGGDVLLGGKPITGLPPHRVFSHGVSRTFQITRELASMTVLENLMLVPQGQTGESLFSVWFRPGRVRKEEAGLQEKAMAVLEFVHLRHLAHEYAGNLSTGQKKLLGLARTMMSEPRVVLLDEPAAGVNPSLMKEMVQYLIKLVEDRDVTIFLIEHDMNVVMSICNPVIVMSNGEVLMEGTPQEVQKDPRVLEAYLGGQVR